MDGQAWFVAGTVPLIAAGGLHAAGALLDAVRPTFFTPVDDTLRTACDRTGIRLSGHSRANPSMWRVWLGVHISHGIGVLAFGLVCLLVAADDFATAERIGLPPLAVAFSATYVILSLRFWFSGPLAITTTSTVCFLVAALAG